MQIFYVDEDPYMAAHDLCDRHICKMTVESAQILSTTIKILMKDSMGIDVQGLYKQTHINHPAMKWARHSFENFHWLYQHLDGLLKEYGERYGKVHKTFYIYKEMRQYVKYLNQHKKTYFPSMEFTEPMFVSDPACVIEGDPVESYRLFYRTHKLVFAKWRNKEIPDWIYE